MVVRHQMNPVSPHLPVTVMDHLVDSCLVAPGLLAWTHLEVEDVVRRRPLLAKFLAHPQVPPNGFEDIRSSYEAPLRRRAPI